MAEWSTSATLTVVSTVAPALVPSSRLTNSVLPFSSIFTVDSFAANSLVAWTCSMAIPIVFCALSRSLGPNFRVCLMRNSLSAILPSFPPCNPSDAESVFQHTTRVWVGLPIVKSEPSWEVARSIYPRSSSTPERFAVEPPFSFANAQTTAPFRSPPWSRLTRDRLHSIRGKNQRSPHSVPGDNGHSQLKNLIRIGADYGAIGIQFSSEHGSTVNGTIGIDAAHRQMLCAVLANSNRQSLTSAARLRQRELQTLIHARVSRQRMPSYYFQSYEPFEAYHSGLLIRYPKRAGY